MRAEGGDDEPISRAIPSFFFFSLFFSSGGLELGKL